MHAGIWVGAGLALDQVQLWREEKTVWVRRQRDADVHS